MRNQFLIDLLEPRRLLSAGDIDSSFGVNGRATLDFTVPADDFPSSVVVLPDGKFLVGHNSFASASNDVGAFSRHLANGQLDTTFGGGTGKVRLGDSWGTNGIEDMFVRTNGEIIAMGRGGTGLAAVRAFDADGNVLPTSSFNFPTSGISTTRIGLLPLTGGGGLLLTGTAVHKFKANGTLDTTFGSAGTFTFPTTSNVRFGGTGFALDSTGAIYISGYNLTTTTGVRQPAIAKLTSNGAFASGWGTNGVLIFSTLSTDSDALTSIVVDSSNRPIVAGTDMATTDRALVARLTTAGALDSTFNSTGVRYFDPPASSDSSSADLAIDPNGRIVFAAAYILKSSGAPTYFVSRINPANGLLDSSFAGDGIQESLLPSSAGVQIWYGPPALDTSGNVIMGIGTRANLSVADGVSTIFRINASNGQRDTTFGQPGGNGTTIVDYTGSADNRPTAAYRQPDGKLIYVGVASGGGVAGWLVGRLNENGTPDTTFGTNGTVRIDWGTQIQTPWDVKLDSNGKVVIAGYIATTASTDADIALARLTSTGTLDPSFGSITTPGLARNTVGTTDEFASALSFQSNGKIIVGGWTEIETNPTGPRLASVLRFNTNGTLDTTFGVAGKRQLDPASSDGIVYDLKVLPDDSILAGGNDEDGTFNNRRFAAKLTSTGAMDTNYGTANSGILYIGAFTDDIRWGNSPFAAFDDQGRIYVPGTTEVFTNGNRYDTAIITRVTPAGALDSTYGVGGTATILLNSSSDNFAAIGVDSRGRTSIGASAGNPASPTNSSDMLVIRLDDKGVIDTSFGASGRKLFDVAANIDIPYGFGFTSDDKLLVLGQSATASTSNDFSATRLDNAATPPPPAWLGAGSAASWDFSTHTLTVTGATTIVGDPAADAPIVTASGAAAVLTIAPIDGRSVHFASLNLAGGATATLASLGASRTAANHRVLVLNALTIDTNSTLDLADNDLIVDYASGMPFIAIESLVRRGYHSNGDWLGTGITSSVLRTPQANGVYTLGVANNGAMSVPITQFDDQTVDLTSVLVKFTHRADRNLDGVINTNDSFLFNGAYNEAVAVSWVKGDLNYDGICSINDSFQFNGGYNESLPAV